MVLTALLSNKTLQSRVLKQLAKYPHTCEELEHSLKALHQSVSPALLSLKRAGLCRRLREQRPTKSGRLASLWDLI